MVAREDEHDPVSDDKELDEKYRYEPGLPPGTLIKVNGLDGAQEVLTAFALPTVSPFVGLNDCMQGVMNNPDKTKVAFQLHALPWTKHEKQASNPKNLLSLASMFTPSFSACTANWMHGIVCITVTFSVSSEQVLLALLCSSCRRTCATGTSTRTSGQILKHRA